MKILLTGATGFLGSHLLRKLIEESHEVIILKRSTSEMSRIIEMEEKFRFYNIDQVGIEEIFRNEAKIDTIIHCATSYGKTIISQIEPYHTNVEFPVDLLLQGIKYGIKLFINTDTFFCKNMIDGGYLNNYVQSKKQFVFWGKQIAEINGIGFKNMKLEHIFGEEDDKEKFIPFIIESCLKNVKQINLTSGDQYRDFIYVDDVVSAFTDVLNNCKENGFIEYEVGTGVSTKVFDIIQYIKLSLNSDTILNFGSIPYRENELPFSVADNSQLFKVNWRLKYSTYAGIDRYLKHSIDKMNKIGG